MKITKVRYSSLFIIVALLLCFACVLHYQLFKRVDYYLFDIQSKNLAAKLKSDEDIVIIALDDNSLAQMKAVAGMWVWPRTVHGQLLSALSKQATQAIAFDILFSEKDIYRPDADMFFNEIIGETDNVFFAALHQKNTNDNLTLKPVLRTDEQLAQSHNHNKNHSQSENLFNWLSLQDSFILPQAINNQYWRLGIINFSAEFDGIGRFYDVFRSVGEHKVNSLAFAVANFAKKQNKYNQNDEGIALPGNDRVLLQWRGDTSQPFTTFSYVDVYRAAILNDKQFLSQFDNRIILIGTTASGLYDARMTAINHNLPGVYMLAMAIDNLKGQRFLTPVIITIQFVVGCIFILIISGCFAFIKSYQKQVAVAAVSFILCGVGLWHVAISLLLEQRVLFIGSILTFSILVFLFYSLLYGYKEYLQRIKTTDMFGRFLHPKMVKKLLKEEKLSPEKLNQKKEVTILFSDIRNFTQISEHIPAEQVLLLLNRYFDTQLKIIFSHRGTLDKFIGDCLMAFWGAPSDDDNHAVLAIDAAIAMEQALLEFKKNLPLPLTDFDIGIGIHTGECIVGMVGAKSRIDYTVIGDSVNLASRIEGLTKGNHRILVSEQCKKLAEHVYQFEFAGEFVVKGRQKQVKLYRPLKVWQCTD